MSNGTWFEEYSEYWLTVFTNNWQCNHSLEFRLTISFLPCYSSVFCQFKHDQKNHLTEERKDGPHAAPTPRAIPTGEFPPGCRCHTGEPASDKASPFIQVHLPQGFLFGGKKSHSVSFQGSVTFVRGTRRSKTQAEHCVLSWSWNWWNSLTPAQQSGLGLSSEHVSKKQRVNWDKGVYNLAPLGKEKQKDCGSEVIPSVMKSWHTLKGFFLDFPSKTGWSVDSYWEWGG